MRGTLLDAGHDASGRGITPAHAGNTVLHMYGPSTSRDHPRACGEHAIPAPYQYDSWGSPPRMRGTPADEIERGHDAGITPAHAGNTACVSSTR